MNVRDPDVILGTGFTAAGGIGLTVQIVTQYASMIAVFLNIALAVGGLYLLYLRVRKARKDIK